MGTLMDGHYQQLSSINRLGSVTLRGRDTFEDENRQLLFLLKSCVSRTWSYIRS
jgi:hypothetical protein